jgi:hypothetical protein
MGRVSSVVGYRRTVRGPGGVAALAGAEMVSAESGVAG